MKKQLFSLALAAALTLSATSFASPLHIAKHIEKWLFTVK